VPTTTLICPSCGSPVSPDDAECPRCGVNIKSGESYETRVRRARGKLRHTEGLVGGLYIALAFIVALSCIGGFSYQARMEHIISQRPDLFREPIQRLQQIDDLIAAGSPVEAREAALALAQELETTADQIQVRSLYAPKTAPPRRYARTRREPEYDRRGAKRLLHNLAEKARFRARALAHTESQT
jgi:hypothetical protein